MMLASDVNENLSCFFLFVCFFVSAISVVFPSYSLNVTTIWFLRYILSFFQEAINEVQRLAKDIRPYAAVSDHVLHNSRRDDTTAFVTSW